MGITWAFLSDRDSNSSPYAPQEKIWMSNRASYTPDFTQLETRMNSDGNQYRSNLDPGSTKSRNFVHGDTEEERHTRRPANGGYFNPSGSREFS